MANTCPCGNPLCRRHIICRYIRRKGKIIYPKNGDFFSFCLEDEEKAADPSNDLAA